jgi:hypothetical protein
MLVAEFLWGFAPFMLSARCGRIEAEGADFGAIYFPSGGGIDPGTGALECRYDHAMGWYR